MDKKIEEWKSLKEWANHEQIQQSIRILRNLGVSQQEILKDLNITEQEYKVSLFEHY